MNTALVCIAKDEDHYIDEWINYHLKLGFNAVFVYANDWSYVPNNKDVFVYYIPGKIQQTNSYNHFIQNHGDCFDWVAFFDVDEFLVLKQHKNIKEFLSDYDECNAVGINWAIFGNNEHETINNNYSVLERFTKRSKVECLVEGKGKNVNEHVKTIVKLPTTTFQDIHTPHASWYNTKKELITGSFNAPVDWSVCQLNHYFSKSTEELKIKCAKGRADNGETRNFTEYEPYLHFNDEIDLSALNFYRG
jgi:hypothetical protein